MSNGDWSQDGRLIRIKVPTLDPDEFIVASFQGHEAMSRLFHYELILVSRNPSIDPTDVVGHPVVINLTQYDGSLREFNGRISRFLKLPDVGDFHRYQADVTPTFWFLSQTADCRIFQEKTVPQILQEIFGDYGVTNYDLAGVQGEHDPWEYCVQYRETALNFACRLMEQEGITFWFKHEGGNDILMLGDRKSAHVDCPLGYETHAAVAQTGGHEEDVVSHWERRYEFQPGKWAQTDYNFEKPSTSLIANETSLVHLERNQMFEIFDYPGEYLEKGPGSTLTKYRMEEEEAQYDVVRGESNVRSLASGFLIQHEDINHDSENGKYLLTSVTHSATQPTPSSESGAGPATYSNSFSCIPAETQFRPPRATLKPTVQGPQTAVVTGPPGEEIYTDKHGRVKIQFHWDRRGNKDANSSCWIRVSHPWAGKNWGAIWNPRIGQEVIVEHLEGDPDRPIITGRVYNEEQKPPYSLPSKQTQSGFKSRSSKEGGPQNFNEIRFEDKKGSEQIYFHAEKDLTTMVENNETRTVCNNRTTTITNDETATVTKGNRTETIKKGNETLEISEGNRDETIKMGNDSLDVSLGNVTHTAPVGTYKIEAMNIEENGTAKIDLVCGGSSIKMTPATIDIVCGGSSIKMTPGTITIQSILVKIN